MTVLIDTGVLYADHDRDATRHESAAAALRAVYRGEYGQPYVTDYLFDEAVTITLARTGSHEAAVSMSRRLRGVSDFPAAYEILRVDRGTFEDAVGVFEEYDDQELSFTDATSIAVCRRRDIETILSFDDDFDGLFSRTDPGEM